MNRKGRKMLFDYFSDIIVDKKVCAEHLKFINFANCNFVTNKSIYKNGKTEC